MPGKPPLPACEAMLTMWPLLRGLHPLDRQLGADDHADQVDLDLAPERVLRLLDERRHRHDPGVVDHHVERAELALGLVEEALRRRRGR